MRYPSSFLPDQHIWAENLHEATRLAQLNHTPLVERVERVGGFQVRDPHTGQTFSYTPSFKVRYASGRTVYEEIAPHTLAESSVSRPKVVAARPFLARSTGRRNAVYRVISEASLKPDISRLLQNDTPLRRFVPSSQRATLSNQLRAATGGAGDGNPSPRQPPAASPGSYGARVRQKLLNQREIFVKAEISAKKKLDEASNALSRITDRTEKMKAKLGPDRTARILEDATKRFNEAQSHYQQVVDNELPDLHKTMRFAVSSRQDFIPKSKECCLTRKR